MITELIAMVRKEFQQTARDVRMLAMLIAVPIVQITIFGFAANLEFKVARTVFVDEDRTEESRALAMALAAEGTFRVRHAIDVGEAERTLRDGAVSVAVVVPKGFGRDLEAKRPTALQVLVDGSDPLQGGSARTAVENFVLERAAKALPGRGPGRVVLQPRLLYNPSLLSPLFVVPGTGASILLIVTTIVTAMGLAREREIGTLEQLLVTPISPLVLMLGKMIPFAIIGLLDEMLMLIVGSLVFSVPLRGPVWIVFVGALAYLVCTLALGLLVSTLAKTQQQALMLGFFLMLPAILLSGFMSPIESMPGWLQPVTWINPVRHFVAISRAVLLRGATLRDVASPLLSLAGIGSSLLALAILRFRRQLA